MASKYIDRHIIVGREEHECITARPMYIGIREGSYGLILFLLKARDKCGFDVSFTSSLRKFYFPRSVFHQTAIIIWPVKY
jgi:hypothetical protein